MLTVNIRDIAIITTTVKNVDYHCIIHNISKSEATNLFKSAVFEDRDYIKKILSEFSVSFFLHFFL